MFLLMKSLGSCLFDVLILYGPKETLEALFDGLFWFRSNPFLDYLSTSNDLVCDASLLSAIPLLLPNFFSKFAPAIVS
jgi:hypothetical protein